MKSLYSARGVCNKPWPEVQECIRDHRAAINIWRSRLPLQLVPDPLTPLSGSPRLQTNTIRLGYDILRILLYNPCVFREYRSAEPPCYVADEFDRLSAQECARAAVDIICCISNTPSVDLPWWGCFPLLLRALTEVMVAVVQGVTEFSAVAEALQTGLEWLRMSGMMTGDEGAEQTYLQINELVHKLMEREAWVQYMPVV